MSTPRFGTKGSFRTLLTLAALLPFAGHAWGQCSPAPLAGCREPTVARRGALRFSFSSNTLAWDWTKGQATDAGDLGDPLTTTSYALCVYQSPPPPDPSPALWISLAVPAGPPCGSSPCWRVLSRGAIRYSSDPSASVNGVTRIHVAPGAEGKARAVVRASGPNLVLPPPAPVVFLPVIAQLQASNGSCWTATYSYGQPLGCTTTRCTLRPEGP